MIRFALSAALIMAPGVAHAAQGACLPPQDFSALATYALPNALSATAQRCAATLPADAFLKGAGGADMIARYGANKTANWPGAKAVFLKLTAEQQGQMVDVMRALPDQQMQQLLDAFIQGVVAEKLPIDRCASVDKLLRLLSPLPAQSTADVIALAVGLGSRTGQVGFGKIQICSQ